MVPSTLHGIQSGMTDGARQKAEERRIHLTQPSFCDEIPSARHPFQGTQERNAGDRGGNGEASFAGSCSGQSRDGQHRAAGVHQFAERCG